MSKLTEQLTRHEGLRLKPYVDTVGKLTIGCGRNLDDELMIDALIRHDYNEASVQMLDSKWARQVGSRATELSSQMRLGYYVNTA